MDRPKCVYVNFYGEVTALRFNCLDSEIVKYKLINLFIFLLGCHLNYISIVQKNFLLHSPSYEHIVSLKPCLLNYKPFIF